MRRSSANSKGHPRARGLELLRAGGAIAALACAASAGALELSGFIGVQTRLFNQSPQFDGQRDQSLSIVWVPEFYHAWDNDDQSLLFVPFARIDSADPERTHADVRELVYQRVGDDWELRLGLGKVFWGVTESQHLVDIVNQTDLVENLDGEDKLGQPMVNLALIRDWGTLNFFALPGFRERTFAGRRGRLRSEPYVDTDQVDYASAARARHIDFAVRWSHVVGDWDIGLSHFHGTSREPTFRPGVGSQGEPVLVPRYDVIDQTGLDVQATSGSWLWKFEGIHRSGQGERFFALTGGFEYTFFGVMDSAADVGVLAEYLYDDRGDSASTLFENDLFVGTRLALNDEQSTEVLAGVIQDLDGEGSFYNVEASRRLGDRWTVELEARVFSGAQRGGPGFSLRSDDHVQLTLLRYF